MPGRKDIPLAFPTAPPGLRADLERMANAVVGSLDQAYADLWARLDPQPQALPALSFGTSVPLSPLDGQDLSVPLPRPDRARGGQLCGLVRRTATGTVTVRAVDCLVDGEPSHELPALCGLYAFYFDGRDYWSLGSGQPASGQPVGTSVWSGTVFSGPAFLGRTAVASSMAWALSSAPGGSDVWATADLSVAPFGLATGASGYVDVSARMVVDGVPGPSSRVGLQGTSAYQSVALQQVLRATGPGAHTAYVQFFGGGGGAGIYVVSGNVVVTVLEGPVGPQGPRGQAGLQGLPGTTGAGSTGAAGPPGAQGPTGPAGATGAGVQGSPGAAGPTGQQGPTGPRGDTGPTGATGSQGATGLPGTAGPTGPAGAAGATGPTGPQGSPGPVLTALGSPPWAIETVTVRTGVSVVVLNVGTPISGFYVPTGSVRNKDVVLGVSSQGVPSATPTSTYVVHPGGTGIYLFGQSGPVVLGNGGTPIGPLDFATKGYVDGLAAGAGATGPTGPQGVQGSPGVTGATGPTGPRGNTGPVGPQGTTGPTGPQGAAGATGPAGAAGAGATGLLPGSGPTGAPLQWNGQTYVLTSTVDLAANDLRTRGDLYLGTGPYPQGGVIRITQGRGIASVNNTTATTLSWMFSSTVDGHLILSDVNTPQVELITGSGTRAMFGQSGGVQFSGPSGPVFLGGVASPVGPYDAANRAFVDGRTVPGGASPGQPLLWMGATAGFTSPNFQQLPLQAGSVSVGPTPAGFGTVRLPAAGSVRAKPASGVGNDVLMMVVGGGDAVYHGDANSGIYVATGAFAGIRVASGMDRVLVAPDSVKLLSSSVQVGTAPGLEVGSVRTGTSFQSVGVGTPVTSNHLPPGTGDRVTVIGLGGTGPAATGAPSGVMLLYGVPTAGLYTRGPSGGVNVLAPNGEWGTWSMEGKARMANSAANQPILRIPASSFGSGSMNLVEADVSTHDTNPLAVQRVGGYVLVSGGVVQSNNSSTLICGSTALGAAALQATGGAYFVSVSPADANQYYWKVVVRVSAVNMGA